MDIFTDDEQLEIKEFYTNKKHTFANTLEPECYSSRKLNGESFGYTLALPYLEQEIIDFEIKHGIKLDPNLRLYLLNVSRELFVASYPSIFDLEIESPCTIPEHETMWNEGDCHIHGEYGNANNTDNCTDDCSNMFDGMVNIGTYGCTFDDFIVVKGNNIGSIWNSDGDTLYKQNTTFRQYVTNKI